MLAALDFNIFMRLMVKNNLELQQQVLLVILHTNGSLPDSMTPGAIQIVAGRPPAPTAPAEHVEEAIMEKVLKSVCLFVLSFCLFVQRRF